MDFMVALFPFATSFDVLGIEPHSLLSPFFSRT